jgi:hypothetical protein
LTTVRDQSALSWALRCAAIRRTGALGWGPKIVVSKQTGRSDVLNGYDEGLYSATKDATGAWIGRKLATPGAGAWNVGLGIDQVAGRIVAT